MKTTKNKNKIKKLWLWLRSNKKTLDFGWQTKTKHQKLHRVSCVITQLTLISLKNNS